ncbi:PREDICTED: GATA transcription factor 9-like [Nelumbo nucifera]|uniref:GATA transcription factor 9-like n=1 Tax=Nelumbo nucifera TaxID=4432 RepID=A0A1U8B2U5_NELNU|nr:PREDICTED: GATA transcription factor 9-like [Nelumbo nucifera]
MAVCESYNAADLLDFKLDDLEENLREIDTPFQAGFDDFPAGFDNFPEIFEGFTGSQLCVPEDDVENLDWFPNFTEDSISLSDVLTASENSSISPTTPERETENGKSYSSVDVCGLLRQTIPSKRPRTKRVGGRVWSGNVMRFSLPESQVPAKAKRGKYNIMGRRCTHCDAEKTPQWRMGPMGPKTLCNACGVRYKSGRLMPEYRPAASPSFNSLLHSNSHKKIMKMRKGE